MSLNVQAFLDTLPIMGKGMAGIFIVTGVIILAMILLRAVSDSDQKKNWNDTAHAQSRPEAIPDGFSVWIKNILRKSQKYIDMLWKY